MLEELFKVVEGHIGIENKQETYQDADSNGNV